MAPPQPVEAVLGAMKRTALALLLCLGALAIAAEGRADHFQCGPPTTHPLWIDFAGGSVTFRNTIFGRPGLVLATSGDVVSQQLRDRGAITLSFVIRLRSLVGLPTAPADPATIPTIANALVDTAARASGCATPLIGLNELSGPYLATPWSPENAQYRANVLTLLQTIAARGARPFLLIPGTPGGPRGPTTAGEAAAWWQQAAQVADLVQQVHFDARFISAKGPLIGSRTRRLAMRRAIATYTAIGIPPARIGLLLGFQSGAGKGGREGLRPRQAWLEVVKLDALAARQVGAEEGIGSIWSWGWGTFGPGSEDRDKAAAACVYLWTRDPSLCDGLAAAGPGFDASLTEGQIALPPETHCTLEAGQIKTAVVDQLAAVTGDRRVALTALFARLVQSLAAGSVSEADTVRAEETVVAQGFGGSWEAYEAELARRGASRTIAQEIIVDELRRQTIEATLRIEDPALSLAGWTEAQEGKALRSAICLRDELPAPGAVALADYLPFLRLPLPAASVTLEAGKPVVLSGEATALFGMVSSERADETVTIYAQAHGVGSFRKVDTLAVDDQGAWSFSVNPTIATSFRALSKSAASAPVLVEVRPRVTLAIRQGAFTAHVEPLRPGATVWLQRWSQARGRWVSVKKVSLDAFSSATFVWNPAPGRYSVRLLLPQRHAGAGYVVGFSAPRTYMHSE